MQIEIDRDDYKPAALHPNLLGFDGEIGIKSFNKEQELKLGHPAPTADENGFGGYIFEEREPEKTKFQLGARYEKRYQRTAKRHKHRFCKKGNFQWYKQQKRV